MGRRMGLLLLGWFGGSLTAPLSAQQAQPAALQAVSSVDGSGVPMEAMAPPGTFALGQAHAEALDVVRGELDRLLEREGAARQSASARSAVALAALALLRTGTGGSSLEDDRRVARLVAAWLQDAPGGSPSGAARAEADELLVVAALLERRGSSAGLSAIELSALGAQRIAALTALLTADGGWAAAGPQADTELTAHGVAALSAARRAGLPVPDALLERALAGLQRARLGVQLVTPGLWPLDAVDGDPAAGPLLPASSVTRVQAVHGALGQAGEAVAADDVLAGLDAFQRHHRVLDLALRHKDGGSSVHGLHAEQYLSAHLSAAELLPQLSRAERSRFRGRLALDVLATRRSDGAYVDGSHGGHGRLVGTARAALTLRALLDA